VRAARVHTIGGVPRIDELDEPAGSEILEVGASSLNPVDLAIASGHFYGGVPDTPFVIGSEAVGNTADGRHLWRYSRGSMAERVDVSDSDTTVKIPDGVDDALALACGIAGLTGWLAVSWHARVTPEDTVLVLGASGTVGATAVQAAKLLGAARVVGAARRVGGVPAAADAVVSLEGAYELPAATVDTLKADDALLTKILTYHVVAGRLSSQEVTGMQKTVEGGDVTVSGTPEALEVGGAKVICGGVQTANATVYLIDGVLTPPAS